MDMCEKCIHKMVCIRSFLKIMEDSIELSESEKLKPMENCFHFVDIANANKHTCTCDKCDSQ